MSKDARLHFDEGKQEYFLRWARLEDVNQKFPPTYEIMIPAHNPRDARRKAAIHLDISESEVDVSLVEEA